jgi:hypothetical protein
MDSDIMAAFPASPTDGQVHEGYRYDATENAWLEIVDPISVPTPVAHYPLNDFDPGSVRDISGNAYVGAKVGYGPVAYYPLEGNTSDYSGNSNDGTPSGGVTYGTGIAGQAAVFDGVDDYISLPRAGVMSAWSDAVTLSCWFSIPSSYDWTAAGGNDIVSLFSAGTFNGSFGIVRMDDTNYIGAYLRHDSDRSEVITNIERDTTYFATFVWDGETLSLWLDGQLIGDTVVSSPTGTPSADDFVLGGAEGLSGSSPRPWFEGTIDEVRIYDYALSAEEVEALYSRHTQPSEYIGGSGGVALHFNGVDQYIDVGPQELLASGGALAFSLSVPDITLAYNLFGNSVGSGTINLLELRTTFFRGETNTNCNFWDSPTIPVNLQSEKIYRFTVVFSSNKSHWYLDGVYFGETPDYGNDDCGGPAVSQLVDDFVFQYVGTGGYNNSVSQLVEDFLFKYLGSGGYNEDFNGYMSNVKLWSTALTSAEVWAEYQSTVAESTPLYQELNYLPSTGTLGDEVYHTDLDALYMWTGTAWVQL